MSLQLIRNNFINFSKEMMSNYRVNWHHRVVARHLEAVVQGEIKRLIITEPPRHGKSVQVSELLPPFYMGHHPEDSVIFTTYGQNLANRFGRKVRNHMESPKYRELFPHSVLSHDSKAKHQFANKSGGEYNAVGRGGPLTGKGGRLIICDDLLKDDKEAASALVRQGLVDWLESTLMTRFEPDAAWIMMATRWNEGDPIGWALEQLADNGWVVLDFPAILEESNEYDERKVGHALWEDRFSLERLQKIKANTSPYFWNAMFQQRPSPPEGNIIKRQWLTNFYKELPPKFDVMISSWDLAFGDGDDSAFVVGQVWGKVGAYAYLVYEFRQQVDFIKTIDAFLMVYALYPPARRKLVERKANGHALIAALEKRVPGIDPIDPQGSKELRAMAVSPILESGHVVLPHPSICPWILDYIEECVIFPKGKFKDRVDATTQALDSLFGAEKSQAERIRKLLTL